MASIDYKEVLTQAFGEYDYLLHQRQILELDLAKKKQFILATINMLPDADQEACRAILDGFSVAELGLTDAIRNVLQRNPKKSFTATEVRDKLRESKFDFSNYKANPLASIHAVLKRLKPEEVESTEIDGVTAWRWTGDPPVNSYEIVRKWLESGDSSKSNVWFELGNIAAHRAGLTNPEALAATGKKAKQIEEIKEKRKE